MLISQSFDEEKFRSGNLLLSRKKREKLFFFLFKQIQTQEKAKKERNIFNFSLFDDILCNSNNENKSTDIEKQTSLRYSCINDLKLAKR